MKSILVTYEVVTWNGNDWETGEAATKLDYLDNNIVDVLIDAADMKISQMDNILYFKWKKLEEILDGIETLRKRAYVNGSSKNIKEVDSDA